MAESLLAHLYSHIKGSQEDVATISLQYILSQSSELNKSFTSFCASLLNIEINENLQYNCQVSGDVLERPDMVGVNSKSEELLLCEMKFYAGLTVNQPLSYIDRLKKFQGSGLLFVCPNQRKTKLWNELKNICIDNKRDVSVVNSHCISVDGVSMAITTWYEIIENLKVVAKQSSLNILSDIEQLKGFCKQMDNESFIPFETEDLESINAKKIKRYHQIIDETTNVLQGDDELTIKLIGKANPFRNGYERKFSINNLVVYLSFDMDLWLSNESVSTPFWCAICDENLNQSAKFIEALNKIPQENKDNSIWDICFLALVPLLNSSFDEVCQDLKNQVIEYIKLFE